MANGQWKMLMCFVSTFQGNCLTHSIRLQQRAIYRILDDSIYSTSHMEIER